MPMTMMRVSPKSLSSVNPARPPQIEIHHNAIWPITPVNWTSMFKQITITNQPWLFNSICLVYAAFIHRSTIPTPPLPAPPWPFLPCPLMQHRLSNSMISRYDDDVECNDSTRFDQADLDHTYKSQVSNASRPNHPLGFCYEYLSLSPRSLPPMDRSRWSITACLKSWFSDVP